MLTFFSVMFDIFFLIGHAASLAYALLFLMFFPVYDYDGCHNGYNNDDCNRHQCRGIRDIILRYLDSGFHLSHLLSFSGQLSRSNFIILSQTSKRADIFWMCSSFGSFSFMHVLFVLLVNFIDVPIKR